MRPDRADFATVLLAASWTGRASLDPADCAAFLLGDDPFPLLLILSLYHGAMLRAPESAKATSKMPCCTAEEAGHLVLKKKAKGQNLGWLGAWSGVVKRWQGNDTRNFVLGTHHPGGGTVCPVSERRTTSCVAGVQPLFRIH